MERFELFEYLGKRNDKEATIYRCGYYIVNRYCNKVESGSVSDTFYTIYDKIFLKIDGLLKENRQYFNVYRMKILSDNQLEKIECITNYLEDISEELVEAIMNIDKYDPGECTLDAFLAELKG